MKVIKTSILRLMVLGLFLCCRYVFAEDINKTIKDQYLKDASSVQGDWKVLPSLMAVPKKSSSHFNQADKVATKSSFEIYKNKPTINGLSSKQTALALVNNIETLPIVYNENRKTLGMLTGKMVLKLKDMNDLDSLVSDMGATISSAYPHLKYAIIKFKRGADLKNVLDTWNNDNRIEKLELEILSDEMKLH